MTAGYLSLTDADREEMLAAIGVSSVEELFEQVPEGVRFTRELEVPPALPEVALVRHLEELAARYPELVLVDADLAALAQHPRRPFHDRPRDEDVWSGLHGTGSFAPGG